MRRRILILLVFAVLLTVAWWSWGGALSLDSLAQQEAWLRGLVQQYAILAPIIGFGTYVALSLIPGTTGKAIVFGWLFGFWTALLIATFSLTIAAVVSLLVVRHFFRDCIERRLASLIRTINRAITRNGPICLVTLRLIHVPYTLTNYASGATAISTVTFAWTTFVGMLPGTAAFVLAGSELPSLKTVAQQGVWSLVDLRLLIVLSLLALLPVLAKQLCRLPESMRTP